MFIYFISAWLSRLSSANPFHLITKTKFFYTHNVYKCLLLGSWGNFSIFWGKIHGVTYGKKKDKVIAKWCSPCAHLRHLCVSLWSKSASFIQPKIKHTSIFPLPVNAEARPQRVRWNPDVWEHSGVTRATMGACSAEVSCHKPIWNWHQTKTGCVSPWAISEESAQRRRLRHLRQLQVKRHRDLPAKSLSDGGS